MYDHLVHRVFIACHTKVYLNLCNFELSQSWKLIGQMAHPPVVPPLTHSMWWVEQISGKFSAIELYLICCIFRAIWLNHTHDLKDFCSTWNLGRQAEKMACGSWKLSLKELNEGYIWYAKKVIQTHLQRCTADIWLTISVILLLIFIEWYIANLTELLRFLNINQFTKISQRN